MVQESHCPLRVFPLVTQKSQEQAELLFSAVSIATLWLWYRNKSMRKHKIHREKELWS